MTTAERRVRSILLEAQAGFYLDMNAPAQSIVSVIQDAVETHEGVSWFIVALLNGLRVEPPRNNNND